MKVICCGPASSMPATPVISVSGEAFCRVAPRIWAISESFISALAYRSSTLDARRSYEIIEFGFRERRASAAYSAGRP